MEIRTRVSLHAKIDCWWNYWVKLEPNEWPVSGPEPDKNHPMYQWCKQTFNSEKYHFDTYTGVLFFIDEIDVSLFALRWNNAKQS